jgi:hypothetical protein
MEGAFSDATVPPFGLCSPAMEKPGLKIQKKSGREVSTTFQPEVKILYETVLTFIAQLEVKLTTSDGIFSGYDRPSGQAILAFAAGFQKGFFFNNKGVPFGFPRKTAQGNGRGPEIEIARELLLQFTHKRFHLVADLPLHALAGIVAEQDGFAYVYLRLHVQRQPKAHQQEKDHFFHLVLHLVLYKVNAFTKAKNHPKR